MFQLSNIYQKNQQKNNEEANFQWQVLSSINKHPTWGNWTWGYWPLGLYL